MKASDLRIGNWVRMQFNSWCPYMDTQINDNDMIKIITEEYDFFEPIPLTEEWLLKFGFKKNDNNQFILMEGSVDILFNKDLNGWTCDGINFSINMTEHVHQLQNLYFALTGEELEIKA